MGRFSSLSVSVPASTIQRPPHCQTVLSVDTLDFTKGLPQRVAAFERLLDKYHMHKGKVILVQVCLTSRTEEGHQIRDMLETRVHSVNSRFGSPDWQPIQLINRPLMDEELVSLYKDADVALVTPLRDGMNLTGKEFVACRTDKDRPGVLILSQFTGAADVMKEALLVNPYEVGKVADYLHSALTMTPAEAEVRMNSLRAREKLQDLEQWMKEFFREIESDLGDRDMRSRKNTMDSIQRSDMSSILSAYLGQSGWSRLCLLLDYDGTLAPHGAHPDLTVLTPATREVLQRLSEMPEVFVCVITGRCLADIRAKVNIRNITYAGNHGIDILHPDGTKFVPPMPEEVEEKASWLLQRLQAECCQSGAWVENKGVVLAFHHEAWKDKDSIDPDLKERLLSRARDLMVEAGFKIGMSDGGLVTEAKPPIKWDKGHAAIHILRCGFGVNWSDRIRIIFAGDDLTDEDAMKALQGLAYSFRVVNSGLVQTLANHRLPDTKGVLAMLQFVESFMLNRRMGL